jgi:ABC-2 type transport system permease protein
MIRTIAAVTIRSLLSRRRSLLLALLALLPIAVALLVRLSGRVGPDLDAITGIVLDRLVITTLVPLAALVFGTTALGAELDDGTAVFLLVKPIARWRIVAAKLAVAVTLTVLLTAPAALLAGTILLADGPGMAVPIGAAVGTAVGAATYATIFLALSLITTRALPMGLVYVLVWEGILAGLFEGTRVLSVRQYALGIAGAIGHPGDPNPSLLDGRTALLLAALAVGISVAIAVRRLITFEIGEAD